MQRVELVLKGNISKKVCLQTRRDCSLDSWKILKKVFLLPSRVRALRKKIKKPHLMYKCDSRVGAVSSPVTTAMKMS